MAHEPLTLSPGIALHHPREDTDTFAPESAATRQNAVGLDRARHPALLRAQQPASAGGTPRDRPRDRRPELAAASFLQCAQMLSAAAARNGSANFAGSASRQFTPEKCIIRTIAAEASACASSSMTAAATRGPWPNSTDTRRPRNPPPQIPQSLPAGTARPHRQIPAHLPPHSAPARERARLIASCSGVRLNTWLEGMFDC